MSSRYSGRGPGHDQTGRTKKKDDHHVRLYAWFMATEAWRALSAAERCVYLEVEARFFGTNNGSIGLSARTAGKACNIAKDTANRAFSRLVELGFIECVTPSSFRTNSCRAPEWRLTRAPCDVTKQRASKAFMTWKPGVEAANVSPKIGTVLSQSVPSRRAKCA